MNAILVRIDVALSSECPRPSSTLLHSRNALRLKRKEQAHLKVVGIRNWPEKNGLCQKSSDKNFIESSGKLRALTDEKVSNDGLKNNREISGRSVICKIAVQQMAIRHAFRFLAKWMPEHRPLRAFMKRRAVIPLLNVITAGWSQMAVQPTFSTSKRSVKSARYCPTANSVKGHFQRRPTTHVSIKPAPGRSNYTSPVTAPPRAAN